MSNLRKCSNCNLYKDVSEFGTKQRKLKDSIKIYPCIYCKICANLKAQLWRQNNPDKVKLNNKNLIPKEKWLANNKEKRKEYEKQYYLDHKDQFKTYSQTAKFKETKKIYKRNRRHNDPIFKLRDGISRAILKVLKQNNSSKSGQSILNFLNYTIIDLKSHLEKQFDEHMSWNNHGIYWHIDHIIPQSDLPYTSMEHPNFKICWALENLRPLEASQNMSDGASRVRHK